MGSLAQELESIKKERDDLKDNVSKLSQELESLKLKNEVAKKPQRMSASLIKSDQRIKFYTGIQSLVVFNVIFGMLKPYLPNLVFWRGSKTIISTKAKPTGCKGMAMASQKWVARINFCLY